MHVAAMDRQIVLLALTELQVTLFSVTILDEAMKVCARVFADAQGRS
jgi:hypothetical protein